MDKSTANLPNTGYQLHFKMEKYSRKGGYLLKRYSFVSSANKCTYIIEVFYYGHMDLFLIKFYNHNSRSRNKYAVMTNKGDVRNILMTNYDLMTDLLKEYPTASFCFIGERRYYRDKQSQEIFVEAMANNIRYRVYKAFIQQAYFQTFINSNFVQLQKDSISGYLLLNKGNKRFSTISLYKECIKAGLGEAYPELNYTA